MGDSTQDLEDLMRTAEQSQRSRRSAGGRARRGLGHVLGWTTVSVVLPGTSFWAAGRRRTGAVLLGLLFLSLAVLAALAVSGVATWAALEVAVRPRALLLAAAAVVACALVWIAVLVAGHLALRRRADLGSAQRVVAWVVTAALVALVAVPAGQVARYALAQRSLLQNVFDDQTATPRDPDLTSPDLAAEDPWEAAPRVNVLLIGSDAGTGRMGTRADTLITASINTVTGDTVLFSLPRNLEYAPFPPGTPGHAEFPNGFWCPGSRECLINGVWTWAQNNSSKFPGDPNPGLTATRQVVGETLGLSIDYFALVDLAGFETLVDAVGGVTIDVQRAVPVPGGTIRPGTQTMDGRTALAYARSRSDSNDYARMRRQRCVIGAMVQQADVATVARSFPALAAAAGNSIRTDVRLEELDAFVDLARRVQGGDVRTVAFTNEVIRSADPDYDLIRRTVQEAFVIEQGSGAAPAPGATNDAAGPGGVGAAVGPVQLVSYSVLARTGVPAATGAPGGSGQPVAPVDDLGEVC